MITIRDLHHPLRVMRNTCLSLNTHEPDEIDQVGLEIVDPICQLASHQLDI